jgi:hypothetical protein
MDYSSGRNKKKSLVAGIFLGSLMLLELGRSLLIEDVDCDLSLPAAIDDHYIYDTEMIVLSCSKPLTNWMLPAIYVIRETPQLIKIPKSPMIFQTSFATLDSFFGRLISNLTTK